METLFIILAIIWIVVPIAAKKKQQQAKQEADRQRAARTSAPQAAAAQQRAQQPMRTTPLAPTPRAPMQVSYEGSGSQEGYSGAVLQGEKPHDVSFTIKQAKSTLTEAKTTITHTVTASSESGHTHQETSATGIMPDCPPGSPTAITQQPLPISDSSFSWDVEQARTGLVMAEILGPCLALRD